MTGCYFSQVAYHYTVACFELKLQKLTYYAVTVMVLLHREILVEESNVQRVDSPVTVSISVSFYNL